MENEIIFRSVDKKTYYHPFCPEGVKFEVRNSNNELLGAYNNINIAKKVAIRFINFYKKIKKPLIVFIDILS